MIQTKPCVCVQYSKWPHILALNLLAHEYNVQLLQCLDRHAPVITRTQVVRPKVPYYDSSVKDLKRARRKAENEWRRNKTDSNLESKFKQARNKCAAKLDYLKTNHFSDAIHEANGDQKRLFSIIQSLTCVNRDNPLPDHVSIQQLANDFANFFIKKIEKIRNEIDVQDIDPPVLPSGPDCQEFSSFNLLSESDVKKLVTESNTTSCELNPLPTHLLKQCIDIILPVLTKMINMSLQTGRCLQQKLNTFPNQGVKL